MNTYNLSTKHIFGENKIIVYLDLCGTKYVYRKFDLEQQLERILIVLGNILAEVQNSFDNKIDNIYLHAYSDTVVLTEKDQGKTDDFLLRAIRFIQNFQYQTLIDSGNLTEKEINKSYNVMPIISRALIGKGDYFGILSNGKDSVDQTFYNISLLGGQAIIEMDKKLSGLPFGLYIEESLIETSKLKKSKLVQVEDQNIFFIKPEKNFDFLREVFDGRNLQTWCQNLINDTGNDEFERKFETWVNVINGTIKVIKKSNDGMKR